MSRRKQAKPRALKRGEWDENSPDIEMGLPDSNNGIANSDKLSESTGEDLCKTVDGEEADMQETVQMYRCESCGLSLDSLKNFMDHRNFDCVADVEDTVLNAGTTQGEPEASLVAMETENSLESDVTARDPPSWQSDDQSLSPSSCATPTDPDVDLSYTIGVTESTPYACQFCEKAFPRLSYLKRHEQSHGDQMPFKCDFCHRLFKHKRSRDRHVKLHTGDKKYRCPHCDSAFSRSDHLKIHMKTHDNAKPFQCTICNRGYNTPAALTSHMQNHKRDQLNPLNFRCMQCTASFQSSQQLQDHVTNHSSDSASPSRDKPFHCPVCLHVATRQDSLIAHIEQAHGGERLKCQICAEAFSSAESLYEHLKVHGVDSADGRVGEPESKKRNVSARLVCMYCTKDSFTTLESLQLHMQAMHRTLVNGDASVNSGAPLSPRSSPSLAARPSSHPVATVPPLCSSSTLSSVAATTAGPSLNCEYCTMKFTSIQGLQKHTLSVHSFTDVISNCPDFVCCPHCTMAFGSATALGEHVQFVHEFAGATSAARSSCSPRTNSAGSSSSKEPLAVAMPSTKTGKSGSSSSKGGHGATGSGSPNAKVNGDCHQFAHPGTLLCSQCNAAFPDFEAFRTHLKTHLDEVVQKFVCSECQGEFGSEEQLDGHVVGHYLSTTTEYGCQSCLKLFAKPDELQKHLMDIHAHHLYRCSLCKEVFDSKVSVQVHFAVKHSNECKLFKCTSCSSVFRSEMEFQLHVKVAHLRKAQPFRCLFCNFSYNSELELQCHLTTHKKQFACTLCDEAFHVEFLLDRHMQSKHAAEVAPTDGLQGSAAAATTETASVEGSPGAVRGKMKGAVSPTSAASGAAATATAAALPVAAVSKKEFKCDICDAELASEMSLNAHRRQVHNIRVSGSQKATQQILSLYCAYCNEACKSRTELENHMKVHTVSCGKHKCNICDEVCPTATTLAEHKLAHCKVVSGSMCVACKVNLKSEDQYYSHLQQHNSQGLPLPCVVCRQTLMSEIEVQMHVKFHLKNAEPLYPCYLCLKQFEMINLIPNGASNGGGVQSYVCKECFHANAPPLSSSSSSSSSSQHPHDEPLRCSDCSVKFESKAELDKHRVAHKKTYQCIKCQMSFDTETEIQLHVASHVLHEGTSHECQLCHKVFDSPAKLQCHLIEHTFEGCGSYSCYMCSAVFTTASLLQQHMLEHGLNSRPYDCSHCHQRFFFRAEFENHLFVHGSELSAATNDDDGALGGDPGSVAEGAEGCELRCSECLRTFASVVALAHHRKIHRRKSGGPFECSLCPDLLLPNALDLQRHYAEAHGDVDLVSLPRGRAKKAYREEFPCPSHPHAAKYTCPECHEEFSLARHLGLHMRSHGGGSGGGRKPYECPVCKKRFTRKENRKAHLKSHGGGDVEPFACPHCGKTFARRRHLREHSLVHAADAPTTCDADASRSLHRHPAYERVSKLCVEPFERVKGPKRHPKRARDVPSGAEEPVSEDAELGSETSPSLSSSVESGDTNDLENGEGGAALADGEANRTIEAPLVAEIKQEVPSPPPVAASD